MNRFRTAGGLGALVVLVAATAACTGGGGATAAQDRTLKMLAAEMKGGATVDAEPFPGGTYTLGYQIQPPNADKRWEASAYVWLPSQLVVNQGDRVTLEIFGVNGKEHASKIEGYGVDFVVKRGQMAKVNFTADKPGTFKILCATHANSMTGELVVLPRT